MSDETQKKPQLEKEIQQRVNLRTLAGYIGVTEQRVLQLCQSGLFERGKDKLVDLRQCTVAYIGNIKEKDKFSIQDEETGLEFKNYADRDNYYKSEDRRISLMEKIGDLVLREHVEEKFYDVIEMCREAFLILPDVLERDADLSRKQTASVQKFTDKKLQALASIQSKGVGK